MVHLKKVFFPIHNNLSIILPVKYGKWLITSKIINFKNGTKDLIMLSKNNGLKSKFLNSTDAGIKKLSLMEWSILISKSKIPMNLFKSKIHSLLTVAIDRIYNGWLREIFKNHNSQNKKWNKIRGMIKSSDQNMRNIETWSNLNLLGWFVLTLWYLNK